MTKDCRHKVFISYYHKDDEVYRRKFEELFGHFIINKSVLPGDINEDNSTEYIKRLIQLEYLTDTSVLVVLVGPKTYCRKHVDWEISAALNRKVGGYSGLLGILLPNYPGYNENKYSPDTIPPKLNDNLESGYSKIIRWTTSESTIKNFIEDAFDARISRSNKIDNTRLQYGKNKCD